MGVGRLLAWLVLGGLAVREGIGPGALSALGGAGVPARDVPLAPTPGSVAAPFPIAPVGPSAHEVVGHTSTPVVRLDTPLEKKSSHLKSK